MAKRKAVWDAQKVRGLREHLNLTQQELAEEMGSRQQTISEWETGLYRPRGLSERLLSMVAEQAGFEYRGATEPSEAESPEPDQRAGTQRRGKRAN